MIVQHFLKWKDAADVGQRVAAASALARAYLTSDLEIDDRVAADAALTMLLEDPSPKVRMALADALATSSNAPRQIVAALVHDQIEIASIMIARSPLVSETDLVMRTKTSPSGLQCVIARRPEISQRLALALSRYGSADSALVLLSNRNARLCQEGRQWLVKRFGSDASVRGALLEQSTLEPDLRYDLMKKAADALAGAGLVGALLGSDASRQLVQDGAQRAVCAVLETLDGAEAAEPFVDALRDHGDLTTITVVHALCRGQVDFLAAVLSRLTDMPRQRVTAILVNERTNQLRALLTDAGFAESVQPVFVTAVGLWRSVAVGQLDASAQEITRRLLEQVETSAANGRSAANDDLVGVLRSIHLELLRENAKAHARDLIAA